MNANHNLKNPKLTLKQIVAGFLALDYLSILLFVPGFYATPGMLKKSPPFEPYSMLNFSRETPIVWLLFFILIACCLHTFVKPQVRWNSSLLLVMHISFTSFNPLVIHEPQQLVSFLLIGLSITDLRNTAKSTLLISKSIVTFLLIYYFIAGFKKLEDPNWINGNALFFLVQWDGLKTQNFLSSLLISILPIQVWKILTWLTLAFELALAPIYQFKKGFRSLAVIGIFLHFFSSFLLDIGSFGVLMALLLFWLVKFKEQQS